MLYATGMTEEDMDKPQVGICSVWYEGSTSSRKRMSVAYSPRVVVVNISHSAGFGTCNVALLE